VRWLRRQRRLAGSVEPMPRRQGSDAWLRAAFELGRQVAQVRQIPSPGTHLQPEVRRVRQLRVSLARYLLCGLD